MIVKDYHGACVQIYSVAYWRLSLMKHVRIEILSRPSPQNIEIILLLFTGKHNQVSLL